MWARDTTTIVNTNQFEQANLSRLQNSSLELSQPRKRTFAHPSLTWRVPCPGTAALGLPHPGSKEAPRYASGPTPRRRSAGKKNPIITQLKTFSHLQFEVARSAFWPASPLSWTCSPRVLWLWLPTLCQKWMTIVCSAIAAGPGYGEAFRKKQFRSLGAKKPQKA